MCLRLKRWSEREGQACLDMMDVFNEGIVADFSVDIGNALSCNKCGGAIVLYAYCWFRDKAGIPCFF